MISGQNVGANASVELELRRSCDQPPVLAAVIRKSRSTANRWNVLYTRREHNNNSATQTDYTLSVRTTADCVGFFEPNDTKDTAKDITLVKQPKRTPSAGRMMQIG